MVHFCDVHGCLSREPDVFSWPKDKARCEIWEKFCQNPKLKKVKKQICAKHFDLKYFIDGSRSKPLLRPTNPISTLDPPTTTLIALCGAAVLSGTTDDTYMEVEAAETNHFNNFIKLLLKNIH